MSDITAKCIYPALRELGHAESPDTVLFGENAVLDSLGLVTFVFAVEENVAREFKKSITLVSDKAFSQKSSPFRTVATLAEFIEELLNA